MNYKNFEELPCWQKARELCQVISKIVNQEKFRKDYNLRDQIWRAAGSAMDNIAEGFDDGSSREFTRFLGYAQRSCGEVQSQLYRALDCEYIDKIQFDNVFELASECRKQIKGFRKYLRNYKGEFKNSEI
ncbi:MAG: four helix bundle protein [Proteobacteria bacterium]|jgi:four helix bundle protein|nr:four helix bundle protein [Pseudomonadota bacterium]